MFVQALDNFASKAIFGHWSCHAKNRLGRHVHIKPTKTKTCMYTVELKNITSYERVNSATAVTVSDTYAMFILFCP